MPNWIWHLLADITPIIGLVCAFIAYIKQIIKGKSYDQLLNCIASTVVEAEQMYKDGKSKEDYVTASVMSLASEIEYNITEEEVRRLIRHLIEITNKVNVNKKS